jgi:basic membrane protein A and related proteins
MMGAHHGSTLDGRRKMSKGKHALFAALVVAAIGALTVATTAPARTDASPTIKAAWIYVGPHNDGGWSQAHDRGRLYVQKALGKKVITTYKESVPEGPQVSQVIDSLVRDGNKIIFATSFGYMDAMAAAAKRYPDVYFEHATGYKTAKNFANYFGAGEDAIYLSGIAAGAATKSNTVGYIVPFPIPEIIRHANAFALGVRLVKPTAKVKLVWTKSWFDPAKERKAAESLASAGADVIGQNVDSPAAGQFAQSKGLPWVGYNSNSQKFAPTSWLVAAVYDWGPYYLKRVRAAANGSWKTGSYWGSLADGFTLLSPYGPKVVAKTKALIAKKRSEIVKGTFYEFQGPLYDQSGKLRVPKGKRMTLPEILSVDWLVQGIEGSPKG